MPLIEIVTFLEEVRMIFKTTINMEEEQHLSRIIRAKRLEKDLSQVELSRMTETSRTFIQNVEKEDNPTIRRIERIFRELGIKIVY